jgi:hypothetical protein
MKRITFILLILISVSGFVDAQTFIDQIIMKSGKTISCKITLVNDQNIFYTYKNKRNVKNDYVSLNDINSYNWISKDFKSENLSNRAIILYDSTNNLKVGIKLTQHCNYPILHMAPTLSIYKKNHNVYIGPEYTILRKNPFGDPIDTWEKTAWGLNFGYRYIINSFWEKANLFAQFNFSIYQVKSKEYQLGPPFVTVHKNTIIENTGGLGVNF